MVERMKTSVEQTQSLTVIIVTNCGICNISYANCQWSVLCSSFARTGMPRPQQKKTACR
jgi:hypothetical protein